MGIGRLRGELLERWRGLREGSTNRRILAATLTIGVGTAVVKLASTGRDILVAGRFGTGDAIDAFVVAFVAVSFVAGILSGSLHVVFQPIYVQARREGLEAAQELLSASLGVTLAILLGSTALLAASSPWLLPVLAPSYGPAKLALAASLLRELLPLVCLMGVAMTLTAILNAADRFVLTALTPIATPLLSGLLLVFLTPRWGIRALSRGIVLGALVEAVWLAWRARGLGLSLRPRWRPHDPGVRRVLGQFLPTVSGQALVTGNGLIDIAMTGWLGPRGASTYMYGVKMPSALLGLFESLWTAILPYYSRAVAAREYGSVRHTFRTWLRLGLLVSLPLTAAFYLATPWLVELLFERGLFTSRDTVDVSLVQRMFLLQTPAYIAAMLMQRLLSSLQAGHLLFRAGVLRALCNVGFNLWFMRSLGVAGIALSTTVTTVVLCLFLLGSLRRVLPCGDGPGAAAS